MSDNRRINDHSKRSLFGRVGGILLGAAVACSIPAYSAWTVWGTDAAAEVRTEAAQEETAVDMDNTMEAVLTGGEDSDAFLRYLYIESPVLTQGLTQNIVVSLPEGSGNVSEASLSIVDEAGCEMSVTMQANVENLILYSYDAAVPGLYTLTKVECVIDGIRHTMNLADYIETSSCQYEVQDVSMAPVHALQDEHIDVEDAENITYGETNFEILDEYPLQRKASGQIVIVIDPGHDARHVGARGNGLKEEEVTLAISKYLKEELETYSNVVVYMTRTDGSCLNPASNSVCLEARVNYAKSVGADLLISVHADAASNSSSAGSVVLVAGQSGYRDEISQITRDSGELIQSELTKLGLKSRGLYIRWSDSSGDEYYYPNGHRADWYSIVRNSMKAGLPGIIVEHGFITNPEEAARYLTSEASRKELGVADATGIANYFGLHKGSAYATLIDDSEELYTEDTPDIAGFIRNLYETCLDRNPTKTEVSNWLLAIARERPTGGELSSGFIWSQEFQNKNLSDEEFVEKLYQVYLGRSSDAEGKAAWVNELEQGASRSEIMEGFALSSEFHKKCAYYGIAQTGGETKNSKLYIELTEFVSDYYRGFLGREPDEDGLEAWVTVLVNGGTAADLTKGFVFSKEFMNKDMDSDEFVECLYEIYLQRSSDPDGKEAWISCLPTMSREEKEAVIRGFLYSQEYRNLCRTYGIDVGSL